MKDSSVNPISQTLPRPSRRGRTLLFAQLVFLAGAVFGGALAVVVIVHQARHVIQHPDELADRLSARLARRLSLSDAQRNQVRDTLLSHQIRMKEIRREVQPRVARELESIHTDVRQLLDPSQQTKWDTLYDDLVKNWMPPMPEITRSNLDK